MAYALTQPPPAILLIFGSIGVGMAAPYVLILVAPWLTSRLRFSGPWTVQVKQLRGFILLAGAVFFSRVLMPVTWQPYLWWLLSLSVIIWAIIIFWCSSAWGSKLLSLATISAAFRVAVYVVVEKAFT